MGNDYTQEDEKFLINPMIASGMEATGSMGTDTPIAPLSLKSKPMFTYFKQKFAQVTNPPIDPIREETVMSLSKPGIIQEIGIFYGYDCQTKE